MAYPDSEHAAHFIGGILTADSSFTTSLGSSNVFFGAVPNATTSQFPLFNGRWLDGYDVNGMNHQNRLLTRMSLMAVIVGLNALSDNNIAAANRMDALLTAQFAVSHNYGSVTRAYNIWREQPIPGRRVEGQAGEIYYEVGGIYTVETVT